MKKIISPKVTRKHVTSLLLLTGASLALLAGSSPVQADTVYKWVNEYDEVQYTQMPPPHGITAIRIKSAPPLHEKGYADKLPPAETTGDSVGDGFSDTDQDEAEGTAGRDARITQSMKENCNNARKNLATLNRGNIRLLKPSGEAYRLTEEQRQQRIEEANDQIRLLCKS